MVHVNFLNDLREAASAYADIVEDEQIDIGSPLRPILVSVRPSVKRVPRVAVFDSPGRHLT